MKLRTSNHYAVFTRVIIMPNRYTVSSKTFLKRGLGFQINLIRYEIEVAPFLRRLKIYRYLFKYRK